MHNGWKKQTLPRLSRTVFNLFLIPNKTLPPRNDCNQLPYTDPFPPPAPLSHGWAQHRETSISALVFPSEDFCSLCVCFCFSFSACSIVSRGGKPADKMPGHSPLPQSLRVLFYLFNPRPTTRTTDRRTICIRVLEHEKSIAAGFVVPMAQFLRRALEQPQLQ